VDCSRYCSTITTTTTTVLWPLDFVGDYLGEPVPDGLNNLDLLEKEIVSGSGISWAICKSASDNQTDNHGGS